MTRITRDILHFHRDATPWSKASSRSSVVKSRALVSVEHRKRGFGRIVSYGRWLARVVREFVARSGGNLDVVREVSQGAEGEMPIMVR